MTVAARLVEIKKDYVLKSETVRALRGVTFDVPEGDYVAIMGPSGSGKSTLLNLLGCLDRPTSGQFYLGPDDVSRMNDDQLSHIRASRIGFIFQSFELISPFSVAENVAAPREIGDRKVESGVVEQMLSEVGLSARADALPYTLSGGEKQRVAIARALIHSPALLLADEPTGSLDRATGERVMTLLLDAVSKRDATLVVITHDETIASRMDRVFEIKNQTLHERK